MNLNMRVHQDVNVSQNLNLAPQLLQWLRLLHVPTTELSEVIRNELETNPALEVEDYADQAELDPLTSEQDTTELDEKQDFLMELDAEWGDDWTRGATSGSGSEGQEKHNYLMDSAVSGTSLYQHLIDQLPLSSLEPELYPLAELIIGSLDNRGYLTLSAQDLASLATATIETAERAIATVQAMEPAGIAAHDLRECLLLQMADRSPDFLPRQITEHYLDAAARKQFADIAQRLDVMEEDISEAMKYIASLDPAPGEQFTSARPLYIESDVTIERENGAWRIDLNDTAIPRLRISASCRRLLEKKTLTPAEAAYVRTKIRAATFLIEGIGQRQETLRKVSEQIVRFQGDYLENEQGDLKPLTMAKLAAMIGVHETTVSRALANKHIRTPRGLFEMKHFFRSGYACADGSYVTPDKVKALIADVIEDEPPLSPLRDTDIVAQLGKQGLKLARRTVAKYREEMNIPSSKERKKAASASVSPRAFQLRARHTPHPVSAVA